MKNITKIALGFILISIMTFTSCKKWIDPDINISPNNPADVPIELILSGVQAEMAFTMMGNDIVRPTNMWMQYLNGNSRQSLTQGRYEYKAADVNNLWGTAYSDIMMDLTQMLDKTKNEEGTVVSPHFAGVAKVLFAWTLGTVTDLWGDVPYSEAFQGIDNLSPTTDTQESIYAAIQTMLDEAIVDLDIETNPESLKSPGAEDLFYAGDLTAWIAAAYTLKAKFELQLSEQDGDMTNVIAWAELGIASNAGNMQFSFDDENNAPLAQFDGERGDVQMGETFVDVLLNDSDPRLNEFCSSAEAGGYAGSPIGTDASGDNYSDMGSYVADDEATVYLITAWENQFILAEANLAEGNTTEAMDAYMLGATYNVMQVEDVDQPTVEGYGWYTATLTVGTLDLEQLIYQKWIAGFGTAIAFNDFRRTGFPDADILVEPEEAAGGMPLRFPYAQDALTYNENISFVNLTVPVWWDNN